jgi:DNA (cytosine-5)-methyltransferase 1
MTLKILNLYCGIGGNRKLWSGDIEVTAVEIDSKIAEIYKDLFPNDKVIVGDAHQYLLQNFQDFDFIWSSPPCPSHSKFRFMTTKMKNPKYSRPIVYPDMNLYEEIILLTHYFKGKWIVENVKGYYNPLKIPKEFGRHYIWSNFNISQIEIKRDNLIKKHSTDLQKMKGFDLSKYKNIRKDTLLRNIVLPELGLHIFESAFKEPKGILHYTLGKEGVK